MTYHQDLWNKTFERNRKVYHDTYDFEKEEGSYDPIVVKVTAIKVPALYSYELLPDDD